MKTTNQKSTVTVRVAPRCDQCPGDAKDRPATLQCRMCGATACGSEHARRHGFQHRYSKWARIQVSA